jgi:hypothetical protein
MITGRYDQHRRRSCTSGVAEHCANDLTSQGLRGVTRRPVDVRCSCSSDQAQCTTQSMIGRCNRTPEWGLQGRVNVIKCNASTAAQPETSTNGTGLCSGRNLAHEQTLGQLRCTKYTTTVVCGCVSCMGVLCYSTALFPMAHKSGALCVALPAVEAHSSAARDQGAGHVSAIYALAMTYVLSPLPEVLPPLVTLDSRAKVWYLQKFSRATVYRRYATIVVGRRTSYISFPSGWQAT